LLEYAVSFNPLLHPHDSGDLEVGGVNHAAGQYEFMTAF